MAEIVTMPKLGFDMAEGTLVRWVAGEGDTVEKGQVLAEIETDKATVEVESSASGVVRKHLVEEGEVVPVNQPIAVLGAADEEINVDQLLGEIAPTAETGLRPAAPVEDQEALPKEPAVEETQEKAAESAQRIQEAPTPAVPAPEVSEVAGDGRLPAGKRASPLARRLAEEKGIDIGKVKGSGPGGRIVKADIEAYTEEPAAPAQAAPSPVVQFPAATRTDRRIPVSRLRAAIGRRMIQSKQQVPHFYVTHEYDMEALLALRSQVNKMLPEEEKLSVNDFLIKATALTLTEFPNLNAALDEKANEVIQYGHINIGVAVAVEGGLLTVVCHDADLKPLRQIGNEVRVMVSRAREGKVRPDDIEGSTFSISNMGMYDVEHFIAIINPPEAAILAIGSAGEVPVIKNGQVMPGMRMKATISIDHRVSDGAEGARFMQALEKYVEEPLRLLV
jgi:pyruvate dehydrogenase E2 component (dihydrolipoamide acetyltransferase)